MINTPRPLQRLLMPWTSTAVIPSTLNPRRRIRSAATTIIIKVLPALTTLCPHSKQVLLRQPMLPNAIWISLPQTLLQLLCAIAVASPATSPSAVPKRMWLPRMIGVSRVRSVPIKSPIPRLLPTMTSPLRLLGPPELLPVPHLQMAGVRRAPVTTSVQEIGRASSPILCRLTCPPPYCANPCTEVYPWPQPRTFQDYHE